MIDQLIKAINADNTTEALKLIGQMSLNELNVVGNEEQMPLYAAAEKNNVEALKALLNKGVNVDIADNEMQQTALFAAALYGNLESAQELVDRGASVKAKDLGETNPLFWSKTKPIAELLLGKGADLSVASNGQNCLHFAAAVGDLEVIKFFIEKVGKGSLDSKNPLGLTPIMLCSKAENTLAFLKAGADVKAVAKNGENALTFAATNGALDVIKVLLTTNAIDLINTPRADGATPLLCAAPSNRGYPKVVDKSIYASVMETLVKNGANINYQNQNPNLFKDTALIIAVKAKAKPVVEMLVKLGADLKLINDVKQTAMDYAKKANLTEIIKLLEVGEKADLALKNGTTKDIPYEEEAFKKLFEQRIDSLKGTDKTELTEDKINLPIEKLILHDIDQKTDDGHTNDLNLTGKESVVDTAD